MKQNHKVALTAGHCEIAQSQGLWQPKQLGMKKQTNHKYNITTEQESERKL